MMNGQNRRSGGTRYEYLVLVLVRRHGLPSWYSVLGLDTFRTRNDSSDAPANKPTGP